MQGASCYWMDYNGECWTYQQVVDYWNNLGYDYTTGQYIMPEQAQKTLEAVQVSKEGISLEWGDIIVFASTYWWVGIIFLIGVVVTSRVVWGVFKESNNIWIKNIRKQLGWDK